MDGGTAVTTAIHIEIILPGLCEGFKVAGAPTEINPIAWVGCVGAVLLVNLVLTRGLLVTVYIVVIHETSLCCVMQLTNDW